MEPNDIAIEFDYNNLHYKGWATPSEKKKATGEPTSFHVVLNDIFFGNVSHADGNWEVDEQRAPELVTKVSAFLKH
jgi:hypothetical protein